MLVMFLAAKLHYCLGPPPRTKLYQQHVALAMQLATHPSSMVNFVVEQSWQVFSVERQLKQAICSFFDLPPQSTKVSLDQLGPTSVINPRHLTLETFKFGLGLAMSGEHASPRLIMTSSHLTYSGLLKTWVSWIPTTF